MAVYSILPTTNLKAEDIRDTLNSNGGSVSNDTATFFSAAANINIWSKYKPVRLAQNFTDMSFYTADNCGLYAKSVDKISGLPSVIDGKMNGWYYKRPTGGSGQPFRLGDFRGYYPKAEKPFYELLVNDKIQKGTILNVDASLLLDSDTSITVADLAMSNYYFGAYVVGSGSNCVKTATAPIKDLIASVSFDTTNWGTGDHNVYVFLSPAIISQTTDVNISGTYYTLPLMPIRTVNVTTQAVTGPFISSSECWSIGTTVDYTIRITQGRQGESVSGFIIKFRYRGKSYSEALVEGESQYSLNVSGTIDSEFKFTYRGTAEIKQALLDSGDAYMYIRYLYGTTEKISDAIPIALLQETPIE